MEGSSWDLQAIVRGSYTNETDHDSLISNDMIKMESPQLPASVFDQYPNSVSTFLDHDEYASFADFFQTATTSLDELEGLYKPFYPVLSQPIFSSQTVSFTDPASISAPRELVKEPDDHPPKHAQHHKNQQTSSSAKTKTSKKNQQNRVMKQVKADGLSSDMWAWRKYGQKPIKGSPYPRSYYRCSSSKGCSARKQVEQSPSDPDIFIITYMSEHDHALPTRRNSLAGISKSKYSSPKPKITTCDHDQAVNSIIGSPNPNNYKVMSPTTSQSVVTYEDQDLRHVNNMCVKKEGEYYEAMFTEQSDGNCGQCAMGSSDDCDNHQIISSDDLFPSLEELLFG